VDPRHLIETFGTIGILVIIFAETGLLIGFFLPGDSLLFTAGLLCAPGISNPVHLNLAIVLPSVLVAAVAGAQTGFLIGQRVGPALFSREESRLFKRSYVDRAEVFFDKGGTRAVVLARFVPVVRTFLNPAAGIAKMPARTFFLANLVGASLWAGGVTVAGYVLGKTVPNIDRYLLPIIAAIIVISLIPVALEFVHSRQKH
jgi:membrane-associated protein